jgi:hypothetical protein
VRLLVKISLVSILLLSGIASAEETSEEVFGPRGEEVNMEKENYILILNAKETCGKEGNNPQPCEIALLYNKNTKKLLLIKLNGKKNKLSKNQIDVNLFLKNPKKYKHYTTEYDLVTLFSGTEDFSTLNARIVTHEDRKKILVSGQSFMAFLDAYIDIHNYTD